MFVFCPLVTHQITQKIFKQIHWFTSRPKWTLHVPNKEVYPTEQGTPWSPPPGETVGRHWSDCLTTPLWLAGDLLTEPLLFTLPSLGDRGRLWFMLSQSLALGFWEQLTPDNRAHEGMLTWKAVEMFRRLPVILFFPFYSSLLGKKAKKVHKQYNLIFAHKAL